MLNIWIRTLRESTLIYTSTFTYNIRTHKTTNLKWLRSRYQEQKIYLNLTYCLRDLTFIMLDYSSSLYDNKLFWTNIEHIQLDHLQSIKLTIKNSSINRITIIFEHSKRSLNSKKSFSKISNQITPLNPKIIRIKYIKVICNIINTLKINLFHPQLTITSSSS